MTVEQWKDCVDLSADVYHKWPLPSETPDSIFHGWTWKQDSPRLPWRLRCNYGNETITQENWELARQRIYPA